MYRRPQPRRYFFQQPIFKQHLGQRFFQLCRFAAKAFDFLGIGLSCSITGQTLLASLQKLFRPAVVQVLVDAFFAAQLGNADFTAKTFQYDTYLLSG